jgi:hypothetical protein
MDCDYKFEICLTKPVGLKAVPDYHYFAWRRAPLPSHQNAVVVPA